MDQNALAELYHIPSFKINPMSEKKAIDVLTKLTRKKEAQRSALVIELKTHFALTYESLKPNTIIKSIFQEIISMPRMGIQARDAAIGLTGGIIAKKLFVGKTQDPVTKSLGILLEMGISNLVTKNAGAIRSIAGLIFKNINKYACHGKAE
jgi:hypothetical protein